MSANEKFTIEELYVLLESLELYHATLSSSSSSDPELITTIEETMERAIVLLFSAKGNK